MTDQPIRPAREHRRRARHRRTLAVAASAALGALLLAGCSSPGDGRGDATVSKSSDVGIPTGRFLRRICRLVSAAVTVIGIPGSRRIDRTPDPTTSPSWPAP